MEHEFQYPFVARPWAMLVVFVVAIIVAHVFLIWIARTRLARRGWKRVDYVWLGIASLAIFGTAGTMRREIAGEFAEIAEERASASYALARHQVALLSSSIVCGAFSTPDAAISGARISARQAQRQEIERLQEEYDQVCAFGREAIRKMPAQMPKESQLPGLGSQPRVEDSLLKELLSNVERWREDYSIRRAELDRIRRDTQHSPLEESVEILAPLLLPLALALRITKVTGELKLESSPAR